MATVHLDDGVGDEDYDIETCEYCGEPIGPYGPFAFGSYKVLCGDCLRIISEDAELYPDWPPADSDI